MKRRGVFIVLVLAVLALAGGAAVLLVSQDDDERSPAQLLAAARTFTGAQKTTSFVGTLKVVTKDPEGGGTFTQDIKVRGAAQLPDDARYVLEGDGFASEVVAIGDTIYGRDADSASALKQEKWASFDTSAKDERSGVVRGDAEAEDDRSDPVRLLRVLGDLRAPVLVERSDDASVIRGTIDPVAIYGQAASEELDKATIQLTLGESDRINRAVVRASGEATTLTSDYTFRSWGAPVQVAAPPKSDLDPTPTIDEEGIAAFKAATLVMPRALPAGWVLDGAGVVSKEDSAEDCEQIEVDYIDPNDEESGYLTLFELPRSCVPDLTPPRGAQPFRAGRYSGYIEEDEEGALVHIAVGNAVIQVDTDLPADVLARVLANLVPLNLQAKPGELPGAAPTTSA